MTPSSSPTQRSRTLLTLWLLALLLPTIAGFWTYVTTRSALVDRLARGRRELTRSLGIRLQQSLDLLVHLARASGGRPEVVAGAAANDSERARASLENAYGTLPGLRGIAVVRREGGVVFARHPAGYHPPAAEGPERSPGEGPTGAPVLVVRAPVPGASGLLVIAEVSLAEVARPVLDTTVGLSGRGFVVDREGRVLVGPEGEPPPRGDLGPLLGPWSLDSRFVGEGPGRQLAALAPLDGYPWAILVTQPEDEALAPMTTFRQWLWLGLFTLIASGLGLGAVLARRLQRDATGLRGEQALLLSVIEGTSDAVFLKDTSGRYRLANSAFGAMLARPVAAVTGRTDLEIAGPELARALAAGDDAVLAGQPTTAEVEVDRDGQPLTFLTSKTPFRDPDGRVEGVIGIARDITDRKRAEEALLRTKDALEEGVRERATALESANAILKAVFDGTADAIYVKDLEGRYLLANAAAARDLGRRPEEMLGRDDTALFTPGDARLIQELDRAVMASGESRTIEQELQIGRETRFFLSTKGPYRDSTGRVVGLIGISRDVTDHKRSQEALRQSQKLESLGLLAGGVAHDFNNLLVAVLGQTTLGQAKLGADHPARENLEKAIKATERAADLTRQMLAYSGRGHFQVRPLQLNAVIEENLHLLGVAVSKRVRLVSELAPDLPLIDADVGQIQQVVMNLITNAAEAIGDREGAATVSTSVRTVGSLDAPAWRHTGQPLPPGSYVALEVRDDGPGMDAATLERIFDPFFTTKFTGRGLGLAAVLGIMRGHKGGLSVESDVGRGTTFRLLFPVSGRTPAPLRRPPEAPPLRGTVLVIDDEDVVREAIADALDSRGWRHLLARDGDEGIALGRDHASEIGLVILDMSMPGRSGEDTLRELRRPLRDVPVILSSGYSEDEAKARFTGQELAGFLQKPYRLNTLLAEVERCLKTGSS